MENRSIPFTELMNAVIDQLKDQKYMDSTLVIYRRFYNRIHVFLNNRLTDVYTHELGKTFLEDVNVCKSTFSFYTCAVRRLDDYIDGKSYRVHHDNPKTDVPSTFSKVLADYLNSCVNNGNKPATVRAKKRDCIIFLKFLDAYGCSDLARLDVEIVMRALLVFPNKDSYARIRLFLKYLSDKGIIGAELSRIVPRYKRPIPLPTVYTTEEISRVEKSVDTNTGCGKRNLAIILLASRMGLRSGDIARLKLSEIDFHSGHIRITQEKTGNPLLLEMPYEVLGALLSHLENDKYTSLDGYVFHSMIAPYGRITTSVIRHALNEAFHTGNVKTSGKKHGPHALRSSLASSMVNDGASYDVVRRILGHNDPDVIKRYAKADIENLRMCSIDPPKPSGRFLVYLSGKEVFCNV